MYFNSKRGGGYLLNVFNIILAMFKRRKGKKKWKALNSISKMIIDREAVETIC
jgi:hypothetical protein